MAVETCRVGVKNLIKMVRKCLSEGIEVVPLLDATVSQLTRHL